MSRDILDLIDNAIEGATGPDAMRWTPDAEQVAGEPCQCLLCAPTAEVRAAIATLDALVLGPQIGAAFTAPVETSDTNLVIAQAWIREQMSRRGSLTYP